MTLPMLAKGIAKFQNACAAYGISVVGALEGNGDSPKDSTTGLIAKLARHFDVDVRLYLQYTDLNRVTPYRKYMTKPRVGGCGDWEMDGATGSHMRQSRDADNGGWKIFLEERGDPWLPLKKNRQHYS